MTYTNYKSFIIFLSKILQSNKFSNLLTTKILQNCSLVASNFSQFQTEGIEKIVIL